MRSRVRRHAPLDCAVDEHRALLGHLFGLFLAHRLAQQVGAAEGVAGEHLRDLHHLLLVEDDPVGGLEDRLEARVQVIDRSITASVLAVDEVIDHARLQGPRAKQRHQRDDLLEPIGLQAADQVLHAAGLELKYRGGAAGAQQCVRAGIVHGQRAHLKRRGSRCTLAIDEVRGAIDDREGPQAEEVELHEARRLDVVFVELRDDASARGIAVERREVGENRGSDHHATCVHAGVAGEALEGAREVDQVAHLILVLVEALELRLLLQCGIERDAELEGNELRDAVDETVGHAEHAPDIAHHGLRRHGAVGDDLRYALAAVLLRHVVDHPVAPVHAEIDVEVRHRDTLGIEKALEQQVMADRIEIRDPQAVGDQRSRSRAAPRSHRHAVIARPADEVGDDEEIAGKAHLADDIELARKALVVCGGCRGGPRESLPKSALALLTQELLGGNARRQRVLRQPRLTEGEHQAATARDLDRVGERLGHIRKERRHLLRRAQVLLSGVAAHAPGVREQSAFLDAHSRLVRLEFRSLEKANVVGGDHRHKAPGSERHGAGDIAFLGGFAEALQLEIEALRKEALPGIERPFGFMLARIDERAADVAFLGSGERDQALERRLREPAALDTRSAALLAFEVRSREEARKVAVAGLRLAQERQARRCGALTLLRDPQVDSHERLHTVAQRLAIELHHREQVVLIGDRDRRHAGGGHRRDELRHPHHAVAEGVLGVQPQMDESLRHGLSVLVLESEHTQHRLIVVLLTGAAAHGTEGATVERRGCTALQRVQVRAGAVTLVRCQLEARVAGIELLHHCVATGLGENRGRADRRDARIAADDRFEGAVEGQIAEAGAAIAIDAHVRRRDRERQQRPPHGEHGRLEDIQ